MSLEKKEKEMRMNICTYCGHQVAAEDLNCFSDMHEGCYRKVIRELDEERDRLKSKKREQRKKKSFSYKLFLVLLFHLKK